MALLTSVSSAMCGLLLRPSYVPEVKRLVDCGSLPRDAYSPESGLHEGHGAGGVLKSGTRDSERKGGGTKKILYHHNLIEGLDT